MSISELKLKAKELLNGKKKDAAIMLLVYFIIVGAISGACTAIFGTNNEEPTALSFCGNIIVSIITIFFTLGQTSYFLKISRNEEVELNELFSKGNLLLKAIAISIIASIFIMLGFIALIIPGIIIAIGYSMTTYILLDNPDVGVTDALKQSREMMKGNKMRYFLLNLSFIGWYILSVFTLGILLFWLIPYIDVTLANFYNEISGKESDNNKSNEPEVISEQN